MSRARMTIPRAYAAARRFSLAATSALLLCGAAAGSSAQPATPSGCSVAGLDWNNDPTFRSSLHPSDRGEAIRTLGCEVESMREIRAGAIALRLTLGRLHQGRPDGPRYIAKYVEIEVIEASGPKTVGRLFIGRDAITGEVEFDPQARAFGDAVVVRLSPRHDRILVLRDSELSPAPAFGWRDAIADVFPDGARSGQNLRLDLDAMEGRVAVRGIATDAGAIASAIRGEDRMVVARLAFRDGGLVAGSAAAVARKPGDEPILDDLASEEKEALSAIGKLPEGVAPCVIFGWSNDTDPKGLNVRAAPDANARVLGIVPPRRALPKEEVFGDEPVKSEFRIVGWKDGWFLVDGIKPPGVAYGGVHPRHLPQPFKGRGWVNGRMLGGALANSGLPAGQLYVSPHIDAASSEVVEAGGNTLGPDSGIRRIHACSGRWALVETNEGRRGWWRGICSNQATNCS